jgi:plastocyanin
MKKFITGFVILSLITALVVACGGPGGPGGGSSTDVHMSSTNFTQSSVTISKGSSLNLVDDTTVVHIIQNGSWDNGTPKPATEPGAPMVNVQFQGSDSHMVGPFNTAGTYHLYCTVHAGMNLTVVVQ